MRSCGVDLGSASGTGQYAEHVTCEASTKQADANPSVRAGAHRSSSRADERM